MFGEAVSVIVSQESADDGVSSHRSQITMATDCKALFIFNSSPEPTLFLCVHCLRFGNFVIKGLRSTSFHCNKQNSNCS
jgi:hypothetical protein